MGFRASARGLWSPKRSRSSCGGAFEHIRNGEAPHPDVQDFIFEAAALALGTANVDVGQKLHLHTLEPFALAELAAAPGLVEGKVPGRVPPGDGFGSLGQKASQRIQGVGVGQEIGPWASPDGLLIDQDHVGNQLQSRSRPSHEPGSIGGLAPGSQPVGIERLLDERALARTRNPADPEQQAQGKAAR